MSHGNHERTSRWKRKILGLPVVAWLLGGLATAALAVVGFIVLLGTSGSVTSAPAIDVYFPAAQASIIAQPDNGDPVCALTRAANDRMNITVTNAEPGDVCEFRITVRNDGESSARLQNFDIESTDGLLGTVGTCGQTINADAEAQVFFHLEVAAEFVPGSTLTFVPATDGLEWRVPGQFSMAQCSQT